MNDQYSEAVNQQYGRKNLSEEILSSLKRAGLDIDNLTREDITTFEEFHIGGRGETRQLIELAEISEDMHVLDVGSGIGGPARTLAAECGCRVTGLELTREYVKAAEMLTERVGLSAQVKFTQGSALEMPFENDTFDRVWMQHVSMNIENKPGLFAEIARVLKPNGRLAFHEVMQGEGGQVHFPVFWSDKPELSFLETPNKVRQILTDCGLNQVHWQDVTDRGLEFFENMLSADGPGLPPLGFKVIVHQDAQAKAANVLRNLKEKRIVVYQAICEPGQ